VTDHQFFALLGNNRFSAVVIEMAMRGIRLIIVEIGVEREIINEGEVTRLRVPEMAAGVVVEIDAVIRGKDVLVTEVVFVNKRISCGRVVAEPRTVV